MVKWKIYKVGKLIEHETQMAANVPYRCPSCERPFSSLDFASLEKTEMMLPLCDICKVEIEMEPVTADSITLSEKYARFMNESQPLVDILKETDKFDASEWLQVNLEQSELPASEKPDVQDVQSTCENSIIVEFDKPPVSASENISGPENVWSEARNIPGISAYYEDLRRAQLSKNRESGSQKSKTAVVDSENKDKDADHLDNASDAEDDDDFEEI